MSEQAPEPCSKIKPEPSKVSTRQYLMDMTRSSPTTTKAITQLPGSAVQPRDSTLSQETHPQKPQEVAQGDLASSSDANNTQILKIDESLILGALEERGFVIDDSAKLHLWSTCTELEKGFISPEVFKHCLRTLLSTQFPGGQTQQALMSTCGFILGIIQSYNEEESAREQARAAAAAAESLRKRHLSTFQTAKDLELESVKIVIATKEVVENAFDDHEVAHLQADSLSIRDFLQEETLPFLREVERSRVSEIPIQLIRRKRAELKEKLEIQRRNVILHYQRAEKGIECMDQETYHVKTNHMPRYAAASALEVLLRTYYALMAQFDPNDIMTDAERSRVLEVANERICSLKALFKRYSEARQQLIENFSSTPSEGTFRTRHYYYVYDAGSQYDVLCPKVEVNKLSDLFPAGKVDRGISEPGIFYYKSKSFTREDATLVPGQRLFQAVRDDVEERLEEGGLVWRQHFQPHVERIGLVCETLQATDPSFSLGNMKISTSPSMPRTLPVLLFDEKLLIDATVPCGYQPLIPGISKQLKIYFALCHIAGKRMVGEWTQTSEVCLVPVGPTVMAVPLYRCEVLVDTTGFEWVAASNGHIPQRAVSFSQNAMSMIPTYMACVEVQLDDGFKLVNPASMAYEVLEGGQLRYLSARYCSSMTGTSDENSYTILCSENKPEE